MRVCQFRHPGNTCCKNKANSAFPRNFLPIVSSENGKDPFVKIIMESNRQAKYNNPVTETGPLDKFKLYKKKTAKPSFAESYFYYEKTIY